MIGFWLRNETRRGYWLVMMNDNASGDLQCNFSYNAFTNDPKVKLFYSWNITSPSSLTFSQSVPSKFIENDLLIFIYNFILRLDIKTKKGEITQQVDKFFSNEIFYKPPSLKWLQFDFFKFQIYILYPTSSNKNC